MVAQLSQDGPGRERWATRSEEPGGPNECPTQWAWRPAETGRLKPAGWTVKAGGWGLSALRARVRQRAEVPTLARNEKTSKQVARKASKILRSKTATKREKSVAGSALTQTRDRKKPKGRRRR